MTSAYDQGRIPVIELRHRLRIAREYAGYDQEQLAEQMGVSRNTIGNIEKARSPARPIVINAWALACGVPRSWLLTGENPTTDPDGGNSLLPRMDSNHQPSDCATVTKLPARLRCRGIKQAA